MIKGYIFDYGGTLDTAGKHWGRVLWNAYVKHGVTVEEAHFRDAYVHAERALGRGTLIGRGDTFFRTLSVKLDLEFGYLFERGCLLAGKTWADKKKNEILDDIYKEVKHTTAYSRGVLIDIKERYPMALVSNFYGNLNTVLEEFGLKDMFDCVIESASVGIRKPDPRIFTLGTEALGLEPGEVVVVGDSLKNDIVPAMEIGCRTAWLKGETWSDDKSCACLPDMVITDISRLAGCVQP